MEEQELALISLASRYVDLRESGVEPEFPYALTETLLASELANMWHSGLYLISGLSRMEINEYFFDRETCYPALATFLAGGMAAIQDRYEIQRPQEYDLMLSNYLTETWQLPEMLRMQTISEYQDIAQLLSQRELDDGAGLEVNELRQNYDHIGDHGDDYSDKESPIALIVHGTFAAKETWWRPQGSFWQYIKGHWPHLYGGSSPFVWSGKNSHKAREVAASQLLRWVRVHSPDPDAPIDLIAHSHGGNICLLAAQMGLQIGRLILLGTPIRTEYMIRQQNIQSIKNVFSVADRIQTPIGTSPNRRAEWRTFGDSSFLSNHIAEDDGAGSRPGHSELHEEQTWVASDLEGVLLRT